MQDLFGGDGKKYKFVACVIRNVNGTWQQIGDDHAPINVSSITQDSTWINVNFSFTAKNVVSFVACPDEDFAKLGYDIGASVGTSVAKIQISQNRILSGYLKYTKSSGTFQQYDDVSSASINTSTGVLTVNHSSIGDQFGRSFNIRYNTYDIGMESIGNSVDTFKLYDHSGNVVLDPDNFEMIWTGCATGKVTPASANTSGNIWCLGIMEVN